MNNQNNETTPIFGTEASNETVVMTSLHKNPVAPEVAYRLIKDQWIDEGNARQNLATFCQTYMDPEVTQLMAETMEKKAIDKSEYP